MAILQALQYWWQQQTLAEITAVVTGLLCVYLAAKNNILNWPFAIISVVIYVFIFNKALLYADMGLQIYFLIVNIYGWYYWSQKPSTNQQVPVVRITAKQMGVATLAIVAFTFILGGLLKYTSASLPYLDSFCAACSIVAHSAGVNGA